MLGWLVMSRALPLIFAIAFNENAKVLAVGLVFTIDSIAKSLTYPTFRTPWHLTDI